MNSNEFRIGNLVYHDNKKEYYRISEGYDIDCGYNYEPIQLKEEILLKCEGIIKHATIENRYLLEDSNYSFHIEDGDWGNPCLDVFIDGMYIICVEFLHEFQNLIYTLTNQELEIEL